MKRAYTEEDAAAMGRIADGMVLDTITELAKTLAEPDLGPKLIARNDLLDHDLRCRLEVLRINLQCVLDEVESRLAKAAP